MEKKHQYSSELNQNEDTSDNLIKRIKSYFETNKSLDRGKKKLF